MAVRRPQHRDLRPHALEPHDAVHPANFDGGLALELESELDEEVDRGCEVVDHDADVVHPLDSQVADGKEPPQRETSVALLDRPHSHVRG